MLFALSTGHKLGLAGTGAAFIIFALLSSFVLPRRNPDFPGRYLVPYLLLSIAFFLAMMSAVFVFGREKKAAAGTSTTTTQTSGGAGIYAGGDPVAGKAVFLGSSGCTGCHTLKAAGSTGSVGPNLDQKMPSQALIVDRVLHGGGVMPPFKTSLTKKQIADVVAFVYTSTHPS